MLDAPALLEWAMRLGAWPLYALLALGAAVENVVPPIPADSFVVLGGVLAGRGHLEVAGVFLASWVGNVLSALAVFWLGRRYGKAFFAGKLGSWLLSPAQVLHMERFFRRWGVLALVSARLLPGIRAAVPGFAGVSGLATRVVAPVLALTSAVWYGGLTWLGMAAGANLDDLLERLQQANRGLLIGSVLVCLAVAAWWRRTRSTSGDGGAS